MSNDSTPVARLSFTDKDKKRFSVLTVWTSRFAGTYSIRKDRGSDRFPSIGLFDALKAWGLGNGYLDVTIESQRERRGTQRDADQRSGGGYDRPGSDDFGGGYGGDPDVPFDRRDRGVQC